MGEQLQHIILQTTAAEEVISVASLRDALRNRKPLTAMKNPEEHLQQAMTELNEKGLICKADKNGSAKYKVTRGPMKGWWQKKALSTHDDKAAQRRHHLVVKAESFPN